MSQISRKWLQDNIINNAKLDNSVAFTVNGLTSNSLVTVNADATINGNLDVNGILDASSLLVTGDTDFSGSVEVVGKLVAHNDATVVGLLTVAGDASVWDQLRTDDLLVLKDGTVNGGFRVVGDLTVDSGVNITGDLTANNIRALNNETVDNNLYVQNDETVSGNLRVDGTVSVGPGTVLIDGTGLSSSTSLDVSATEIRLNADTSVSDNIHISGLAGVGVDPTTNLDVYINTSGDQVPLVVRNVQHAIAASCSIVARQQLAAGTGFGKELNAVLMAHKSSDKAYVGYNDPFAGQGAYASFGPFPGYQIELSKTVMVDSSIGVGTWPTTDLDVLISSTGDQVPVVARNDQYISSASCSIVARQQSGVSTQVNAYLTADQDRAYLSYAHNTSGQGAFISLGSSGDGFPITLDGTATIVGDTTVGNNLYVSNDETVAGNLRVDGTVSIGTGTTYIDGTGVSVTGRVSIGSITASVTPATSADELVISNGSNPAGLSVITPEDTSGVLLFKSEDGVSTQYETLRIESEYNTSPATPVSYMKAGHTLLIQSVDSAGAIFFDVGDNSVRIDDGGSQFRDGTNVLFYIEPTKVTCSVDMTISDKLHVTGDATTDGGLLVGSNLTVSGAINVSGNSNLADIFASNFTGTDIIGERLNIINDATIGSKVYMTGAGLGVGTVPPSTDFDVLINSSGHNIPAVFRNSQTSIAATNSLVVRQQTSGFDVDAQVMAAMFGDRTGVFISYKNPYSGDGAYIFLGSSSQGYPIYMLGNATVSSQLIVNSMQSDSTATNFQQVYVDTDTGRLFTM